MKETIIIVGAVVALIASGFGLVAHEVGTFCSEVNPLAPEDYPRVDIGQDF